MCTALTNEVLADQETNTKARSGVDMSKRAMIKVKGKEDFIMTYSVDRVRAAKNQRLNKNGDAELDLQVPGDYFTHVGSYVSCSQLDCILGDSETIDDSGACVVVMNFDNEDEFASAISFPPPAGGVRLMLQENGGDIISYSQSGPGYYTVTALFLSSPGASLICTRESGSSRSSSLLLEDVNRSILSITQVKSFGVALGNVALDAVGGLWIAQGSAVADAHVASARALAEDQAVVGAISLPDFPPDRAE
jgi:hypothetical protein